MSYILAILVPPLACILVGRPTSGVLLAVLMLTLFGWPIASILAILVVMDAKADKRAKEVRHG